MKVSIYHNPKCSKSRETLALLQQESLELDIIDYLKNPPNRTELIKLAQKLNLPIHQIIRTKEPEFLQLVENPQNDEQCLVAILNSPKLLERPIVVLNDIAVFGRPPENIYKLFTKKTAAILIKNDNE